MVNRGKEYIREGDIFQVVLSNRLEADNGGKPSRIPTGCFSTTNPSPYMFYFSSDDMERLPGHRPETLVKLEDGKLHTFPLAGTRPRGDNAGGGSKHWKRELLADEKERAEHNMLVDLGRNDIGKISRVGSVQSGKIYESVERFSHVMHIGSTVSGMHPEEGQGCAGCGGCDSAGRNPFRGAEASGM